MRRNMAYSLKTYAVQKCEMCGAIIEGQPIWKRIGKTEHLFCSQRCGELCEQRGCILVLVRNR